MWRWPSHRFWRIRSALFAVLLTVLCANALFMGWHFMLALGEGPEPWYLPALAWLSLTPLYPRKDFPTSHGLLNLIIALAVNAIAWAWVVSLTAAAVVEVVGRRGRRDRAATT